MINTLQKYSNEINRIIKYPRKTKARNTVLNYLSSKFDYGKKYSETEVNDIIAEWHTFNDICLLRRELISRRFFSRTNNCELYWKNPYFVISEPWETQNLVIQDSKLSDTEKLQNICDNLSYAMEWSQESKDDYPNIKNMIKNGNLPPEGGRKELSKFQTIRMKQIGTIIGYISYYLGWPKEDITWLAVLAIDPEHQNKGLGTEVIVQFAKEIQQMETFTRIQLLVELKNWPALRFWIHHGFNRIVSYSGDKIIANDKYAHLVLEMPLC